MEFLGEFLLFITPIGVALWCILLIASGQR
jgi:hypothetical protein